jgi:hypothetical protein
VVRGREGVSPHPLGSTLLHLTPRNPNPNTPTTTRQHDDDDDDDEQELMHHYLVQDPLFLASPGEAMTGACRRMDREVLEICERESLYCGTTAIMALIRCVRGGRGLGCMRRWVGGVD